MTAPVDSVDILSRISLFQSLSQDELRELAQLGVTREYGRNQLIFNRGDPGDGLYAIIKGRVGIRTYSISGKEVFLNILEANEVFGEIALLDGKERTAGAVTMTRARLMFIGRNRFLRLLETRPRMCIELMEVMCARLRWVSDLVEDVMFRDIRSRLARRLLRLAGAHGRADKNGIRISLRISQQELGLMLGATRESINKEIGILQSDGIIDIRGRHITVRDPEALERIAMQD